MRAEARQGQGRAAVVVPIRRQLLAVAVLGLLTVAAYKHVVVPAWTAWVGVVMALVYLLFSGWLYEWSQRWAQTARAAREGQKQHDAGA